MDTISAPESPDALYEAADKTLEQYKAARERESAARDLLRHAVKQRQTLFQQYLYAFDNLKKRDDVPSGSLDQLIIKLQSIQNTGTNP